MVDDFFFILDKVIESYLVLFIEVFEGFELVCKCFGMYIGGIDECVLYYFVVEILDNLMDEVVVGYVNCIEVELLVDFSVVVCDNGCGILIDLYLKFFGKLVLEVILCMLYVGGKFLGDVYQILGGLYGVGVLVVNVLLDMMVVQVVCNKELFEQCFLCGILLGLVEKIGVVLNWCGMIVIFYVDEEIFGYYCFKFVWLIKMVKFKVYLFLGVEICWKFEIDDGEILVEVMFYFFGGLVDYLIEMLGSSSIYVDWFFVGSVDFKEKFNVLGKVDWVINWMLLCDGFIQFYCNIVFMFEGGMYEVGFWLVILKGICGYGELINNKKVVNIICDDLLIGGCVLVLCFI